MEDEEEIREFKVTFKVDKNNNSKVIIENVKVNDIEIFIFLFEVTEIYRKIIIQKALDDLDYEKITDKNKDDVNEYISFLKDNNINIGVV